MIRTESNLLEINKYYLKEEGIIYRIVFSCFTTYLNMFFLSLYLGILVRSKNSYLNKLKLE